MPQKFFAAPVDRPFVFPSSVLLSRSMVYSSSRLRSSFPRRIVFAFIPPCVVCYPNGALLSAPFFTSSLPAFSFLFLFIIFFTLRDTRALFVSHSLLSSVRFRLLSFWFHTFIFLTRMYIYTTAFSSILCSFNDFILCFQFLLLVLLARSLRLFFFLLVDRDASRSNAV